MSSIYSDWLLFERQRITPGDLKRVLSGYDRFISAFNSSQRVCSVFEEVNCAAKHWLIFPEYKLSLSQLPATGAKFIYESREENEVIQEYFDQNPIIGGERICIDSTGFLRPHLLFLLRYLYEIGCSCVDMIYSEPERYIKGSGTQFSSQITEVRPVRGYEGSHVRSLDSDGDYLIVGCGYDTDLMHAISNTHKHANKVQMFPFPPLRPHMYQENRLKTKLCHDAFGRVIEQCFAPGYDPFATAMTLENIINTNKSAIKNLYLAPLATKPQVIGFGCYYLRHCVGTSASVVFPFTERYNQETSQGISETWKYVIDFDLIRNS
jgi:hypothetical protein